MRKRLINQWEGLFSSFWGRSKDVGRIQIKGNQIRVELGKLDLCSSCHSPFLFVLLGSVHW